MGLKERLGKVAPELAGALGGPLAEAAVAVAARAVLGDSAAGRQALEEALGEASPETLLELRRASLAFQEALNAARAIDAQDRASARQREIALKDRVPAILALTVVGGFFAVLAGMLRGGGLDEAGAPLSIMLGALGTMAASVMNYYFGSSAGSRDKDAALQRGFTAGGALR